MCVNPDEGVKKHQAFALVLSTVMPPRCAAAHGFTVATGYGKLKEPTFRIGHMGDHTLDELETLLNVLDDEL